MVTRSGSFWKLSTFSTVMLVMLNVHAQTAPQIAPKREENIVVTQPKPGDGVEEQKAKAALNRMYTALGGPEGAWYRHDYVLRGHTSSFYKNAPTAVGDFLQFHHVLPTGFEDRIELGKKRDVVQQWTPTEGLDITYKGRKPLPAKDQTEYFRRTKYSLDAIANTWLKDPQTLVMYDGTAVVARREVERVSLTDRNNDSVEVDIDLSTHLPMRRIFKFRNELYKDFDEDVEEYSDFHDVSGVPVPYVTTRYFNGDMVAQRFVEELTMKPVDPALFETNAPLGKHK